MTNEVDHQQPVVEICGPDFDTVCQHERPMELPRSDAATASETPLFLAVAITPEGELFLGDEKLAPEVFGQRVADAAQALVERLRPHFNDRVLGPEVPGVAWVRDLHIRNILVKLGRGHHASEKDEVRSAFEDLRASETHGRVRIIADVDPI